MTHGGGLDPHWFDYPSLLLYVLAPFQAWQDEPSYLTARLIVAAIGVGGGRRRVVARPRRVRPHRRLRRRRGRRGRDDRRRLLAHGRDRRRDDRARSPSRSRSRSRSRLEWAGVAAGLAASAKYPAVFLVAPLIVAGVGAVATPRDLARPRRARVPGDEPVRARPPAPGLVGRDARPAPRARRLARLRARLVGALLVHREALVGARAGARDLASSASSSP